MAALDAVAVRSEWHNAYKELWKMLKRQNRS